MTDYATIAYSEDALPQAISPEGAEIANAYLTNACSVKSTSDQLGIPTYEISAILNEPLVKTYVQSILKETGYRHMVKISEKLDDLIERKWEELEEAEMGSNKDIADLLQLAHKMQVDMAKIIQSETDKGPKIQKNTQINNFGEGNYGKLMERLINNG